MFKNEEKVTKQHSRAIKKYFCSLCPSSCGYTADSTKQLHL